MSAKPGARRLQLTVFEPEFGALARSQVVTLIAPNGARSERPVSAGLQVLTFPLAGALAPQEPMVIELRSSSSIVPKDLGMSNDPRRLSFILRQAIAR